MPTVNTSSQKDVTKGTEVFPNAACKIFLTATPDTRAQRRHQELTDRGLDVTFEEVLATQEKRDQEDAERPVGALRPARDATIVYTDNMSQEEVVDKLAAIVRARLNQDSPHNSAQIPH